MEKGKRMIDKEATDTVIKTKSKRKNLFNGKPGPGRPKGLANKATVEFKQTIKALLEENSENVSKWLSEVAATDPGKALDLLTKLAEFAAPKLSRTEVSGDKDNPLTIHTITRTIIDPVTINQNLKEVKEIK